MADMSDNGDKDLPSEGSKEKVNRKCHVSFFRLSSGDLLDCLSAICFIFVVGPGGGARVGVDQKPGVGVRIGVGVRVEQPYHDSAPLYARMVTGCCQTCCIGKGRYTRHMHIHSQYIGTVSWIDR